MPGLTTKLTVLPSAPNSTTQFGVAEWSIMYQSSYATTVSQPGPGVVGGRTPARTAESSTAFVPVPYTSMS